MCACVYVCVCAFSHEPIGTKPYTLLPDSACVLRVSGLTRDGATNPSRETKRSGANGDRENHIFLVQLITARIDNLVV